MSRKPQTFGGRAVPAGYVAGLGRGAVGFTTRVDLGPAFRDHPGDPSAHGAANGANGARLAPLAARTDFGKAPAGYVAGAGRGSGGFVKRDGDDEDDDVAQNAKWGHDDDAQLHENGEGRYDDADDEADKVWKMVEDRVAQRRKRKREAQQAAGDEKALVADQFADLKQGLKQVSYEEWDAIPEAATGVRAHKRQDTFTPVSDAIILAKHSGGASIETSLNIERGRMIRDKLDDENKASQGSVDVDGYLSSLAGLGVSASMTQLGDIKKARHLLKSATNTNPTHGPGWIAAARLEEVAGKLIDARSIIRAGCDACPQDEDVWIEAARLNSPHNAKIILENAIQHLPKSVRIWQTAAELETSDPERKKRVLRRALETIPNSEKLWMALIEMETTESDAHILLARAVECVPHSVDMWLALAQMEQYEKAKIVINTARKKNPAEPRIWVAACSLDEANSLPSLEGASSPEERQLLEDALMKRLNKLLSRAVSTLSTASNLIVDRERWLELAKQMEKENSVYTCRAIVHSSLTLGLEETDWRRTWLDDAQTCVSGGYTETARALYMENIERFHGQKGILLDAITFESRHGSKQTLHRLLEYAVSRCPDAELFWLMAAKEAWKTSNDIDAAQRFLDRAFEAGHNTERVWLANFKLAWETGQTAKAASHLEKAREVCPTAGIFMKSALLGRVELSKLSPSAPDFEQRRKSVESLLQDSCSRFPTSPKLWMMAADFELDFVAKFTSDPTAKKGSIEKARSMFVRGLKENPTCATMWILASKLEEKYVGAPKARSVLELARLKCPQNADIWLESVRIEDKHNTAAVAKSTLSKALQECPKSGRLWAHAILKAAKHEEKSTCADALQHCETDSHVFTALGCLFARDRKRKPARKWFEKAVQTNPDNADAWIAYYEFAVKGAESVDDAVAVLSRFTKADPHHGERWQQTAKLDRNRHKSCTEIMDQIVPQPKTR